MFDFFLDHASRGFTNVGWGGRLLYLLVVTQLTILTVTLYLHRSQTHRSVDFNPVIAHFFRFWSWLTTSMVTKEWVAIHRKHHAHSETDQDPHSPHIYGIRKLLLNGAELYIDARGDADLLDQYGRGTPDDWLERNVYAPHCNWGPTLLMFINVGLFGIVGIAIWALQMIWIPFWGAGVVNGLGHLRGYRNFVTPDRSTNLAPWGLWVGGEELHNNHHAFPSSAKFSVKRFEFDIGWLVIRVLETLHLAQVKRVVYAQAATPLSATSAGPLGDSALRVQATLAPRVRVMTDFFRDVTLPVLRDEIRRNGSKAPPRKLRRALADGGQWLDPPDRERLNSWVAAEPLLQTICQFRAQLWKLMERRDADAIARELLQWASAADRSGIASLRIFAAGLNDYALT